MSKRGSVVEVVTCKRSVIKEELMASLSTFAQLLRSVVLLPVFGPSTHAALTAYDHADAAPLSAFAETKAKTNIDMKHKRRNGRFMNRWVQ